MAICVLCKEKTDTNTDPCRSCLHAATQQGWRPFRCHVCCTVREDSVGGRLMIYNGMAVRACLQCVKEKRGQA